jgi:hypothetical protein
LSLKCLNHDFSKIFKIAKIALQDKNLGYPANLIKISVQTTGAFGDTNFLRNFAASYFIINNK